MSIPIDRRFLYALLLATTVPAFAQQTAWNDPSPHKVTLVAADAGVQLDVLDWGGSGPALVLLAGLGDTAHVFDDFAQALTPRHRVVGVTRRGFGRSSPSPNGYGVARLAEDVAHVIATLGLDRPIVVGHSFAGEEMHLLGARHLMRPWYAADDPAVRERVQTLYPLAREQFYRHRKWFEGFAERGRVEELAGPHYLTLTHPRELVALIEAFAAR